MPFEYGFKERIKLVKLKGGKPKIVRVKREKQLINLGGKVKGDLKAGKKGIKDETTEVVDVPILVPVVEEKKEVAKVSLDQLLNTNVKTEIKNEAAMSF